MTNKNTPVSVLAALEAKPFTVNVFKDGAAWVAETVSGDVGAQGRSIEQVMFRFGAVMKAEMLHAEGRLELEDWNPPRSPQGEDRG